MRTFILAALAASPCLAQQTLPFEYIQLEADFDNQPQTILRVPASLEAYLEQSNDSVFVDAPLSSTISVSVTNTAPFPIDGADLIFLYQETLLAGTGSGGSFCVCWGTDGSPSNSSVSLPTLPALSTVDLSLDWGIGLGSYTPSPINTSHCGSSGMIGDGPVGILWHGGPNGILGIDVAPGLESFLSYAQEDISTRVDFEVRYKFNLPQLAANAYCASAVNSTGSVAALEAYGSDLVSDNFLVLHGHDLPPGNLGYFIMSPTQTQVTTFGGGQGTLCLGAPIFRFVDDLRPIEGDGTVTFKPELDELPQGTIIQAGESWNFQFWHRDANPQLTNNTSNGLAVAFQ